MQTVVLTEPYCLTLTDTPTPGDPPPGHALLRVHRIGVCGTDLHAFEGRQTFFTYPRILGHELGAEVVALHPEAKGQPPVAVGDRCAVEAYTHCGVCVACRQGKTNCCTALSYLGVHMDGGMRPYITFPMTKLHPSQTLGYDELALVEMLTIGAHAVARARLEPGETVLVIGVGPIGLSVAQMALLAGARVLALDVDEYRLAFSCSQLGITDTILAGPKTAETIRDLTNGDWPGVVFDATGAPASMNQAIYYLAHGGRLVFVGHHPGEITLSNPEFHRREATVLATRNSTATDYQTVIALLESGRIHPHPWITHRASLEQVVSVFPTWVPRETRVVKAMISI